MAEDQDPTAQPDRGDLWAKALERAPDRETLDRSPSRNPVQMMRQMRRMRRK